MNNAEFGRSSDAEFQMSRRNFLAGVAGAAGLIAMGTLGAESAAAQPVQGSGIRTVRSYVPGSLVRRVETDKPYISFTFDDGPWKVNTEAIMDTFADFGLEGKATFFQIGDNVKNHLSIAEEVRDRGYEIGNHSMTHSIYKSVPIAREIPKTQLLMQEMLGITPRFFRSPGLTQGAAIQRAVKKAKMVNIFTDSDIGDWRPERLTKDEIVANFDKYKRAGQFVLLHDGGSHKPTVDALPYMLDIALNSGLKVVKANTLLKSGTHRS